MSFGPKEAYLYLSCDFYGFMFNVCQQNWTNSFYEQRNFSFHITDEVLWGLDSLVEDDDDDDDDTHPVSWISRFSGHAWLSWPAWVPLHQPDHK